MADQVPDGAGKPPEGEPGGKPPEPRTYSEEEFKKLIADRDKAKERLRLIDEEAKKAEEEKYGGMKVQGILDTINNNRPGGANG